MVIHWVIKTGNILSFLNIPAQSLTNEIVTNAIASARNKQATDADLTILLATPNSSEYYAEANKFLFKHYLKLRFAEGEADHLEKMRSFAFNSADQKCINKFVDLLMTLNAQKANLLAAPADKVSPTFFRK